MTSSSTVGTVAGPSTAVRWPVTSRSMEPVPDALRQRGAADRNGNLVYRKTARNFEPVMATAARTAIAQVRHVVEVGEIDPEAVVTPGIYVDRVVQVPS